MAGKLITLEGVEGVGKSTNLQFVRKRLERAGKQVVVTREPGGTPLAEAIRELVLRPWEETVPLDCELLLMFAARAAHLENLIKPALAGGSWVVCDRFTDATYAYQGTGRGAPMARIEALEEWVQGELRPHLTLLLDAPVETASERLQSRVDGGVPEDRFEAEEAGFFEKIRQGYLRLAREQPHRIKVIDASLTLESVRNQIDEALGSLLGGPDG